MQKIHFIAIGGAAMHNLAIALHKKGYIVSGSDDEIFEPSKSRLGSYGLLPEKDGWYESKITADLDAVILGMHARIDNPELIRAKELGVKIYSYPEYLYEQSKEKKRIVIAGSHGKTTITAMILHVLQQQGIECDYMVGAQLEGFDVMVKLTESAPYMIIEGDEYLTSPIDKRPKFHLYKPHIAVISGIAWDHINVFPTFDCYIEQFEIFINLIDSEGTLVYYNGDEVLSEICKKSKNPAEKIPYVAYPSLLEHDKMQIVTEKGNFPIMVFGQHNLSNFKAASLVCKKLGVSEYDFLNAISSFSGASKRLELVKKTSKGYFYKDFAHAPSKLKATVDAIKSRYTDHHLVACLELHTFSSLNENFLPLYKSSMNNADTACVYFNPHTLAHKKLPPLSIEKVKDFFGRDDLLVFNDSLKIKEFIKKKCDELDERFNVLMMSSGNFDGIDFETFANEVL
ncbi:MAG: Mur ligase family protein [Bacteroidales bacterium]|nr:Mur ligase family protein [Bacteroidales bacterium]